MASCPFRRQKSNNRLLDSNLNESPVRQESLGTLGVHGEEEEDTQTLNLKVLNEAVRLLTEPGVSSEKVFFPLCTCHRRGHSITFE